MSCTSSRCSLVAADAPPLHHCPSPLSSLSPSASLQEELVISSSTTPPLHLHSLGSASAGPSDFTRPDDCTRHSDNSNAGRGTRTRTHTLSLREPEDAKPSFLAAHYQAPVVLCLQSEAPLLAVHARARVHVRVRVRVRSGGACASTSTNSRVLTSIHGHIHSNS